MDRKDLETYLQASCEQIDKMTKQKNALLSEINDLQVDFRRKISKDSQLSLRNGMKGSEICPTNYAASHQRATKLETILNQYKADRAELREEISYDREILRQVKTAYEVNLPVAKSSLKIAPFNNSDLRKIYNFVELLLQKAEDPTEKEELRIACYLLSGDIKVIGNYMSDVRISFEKTRENFERDLDQITRHSHKTIRKVQKLHESMDTLTKKIESLTPLMPSVKKELMAQIKELGDTHSPLSKIEKQTQNLREKKKKLKNDCSTLAAELLLRPLDEGAHKQDMDESVHLKQKMMLMEIEINESRQKTAFIKSQIQGALESVEQAQNARSVILKQSDRVKLAAFEKYGKKARLEEIGIDSTDVPSILALSSKTTPDEMDEYLEKLRENVESAVNHKRNLKSKVEQLKDQNKQFSKQIKEMRELLTTTIP